MNKKNFYNRVLTGSFLLLISLFMYMYFFFSIYFLIVFGVLSILEFFNLTKKILKKKKTGLFFNIIFIIYISFFCYFFLYFLYYIQLKYILFILLLGCIASDVGGFVVGRIIKGPRLTKISPNKTFSGAIGSIFFTCVTISSLIFFLSNNFSYFFLMISILTSIGCQLGDLFFSYLKRKAKLKDTGKILPGHGGVLDRVDGILLGIPTGMIALILLN